MAFTVSNVFNSDYGNHKVACYRVTADATSGGFSASVVPVIDASYSIEKMAATTVMPAIAINKGVSGTAIVGQISMTSTVANDIYRVIVRSGS